MIKKLFLIAAVMTVFAGMLQASVTIRYYNRDSKTHVMNVKISGSSKTVEFGSSRTSTVTVQGGGSECVIESAGGKVTVKDGANIEIKDGKITVK